jgi:hypothetical protein
MKGGENVSNLSSKKADSEREELRKELDLLFNVNPKLKKMTKSLDLDAASLDQLRVLGKALSKLHETGTSSARTYSEPRRPDPAMTSGR